VVSFHINNKRNLRNADFRSSTLMRAMSEDQCRSAFFNSRDLDKKEGLRKMRPLGNRSPQSNSLKEHIEHKESEGVRGLCDLCGKIRLANAKGEKPTLLSRERKATMLRFHLEMKRREGGEEAGRGAGTLGSLNNALHLSYT
jgi:hypothetical protein